MREWQASEGEYQRSVRRRRRFLSGEKDFSTGRQWRWRRCLLPLFAAASYALLRVVL